MAEVAPDMSTPNWIAKDYGPCLTRKTYGRIWVRRAEDVETVLAIMAEINDDEMNYMPADFVEVWPDDPSDAELVYGHKFEFRTDLLEYECFVRGVLIYIVTDGRELG